ncbi:hypothetical protein ACSBR2_008707 [Camellia fascicularis]
MIKLPFERGLNAITNLYYFIKTLQKQILSFWGFKLNGSYNKWSILVIVVSWQLIQLLELLEKFWFKPNRQTYIRLVVEFYALNKLRTFLEQLMPCQPLCHVNNLSTTGFQNLAPTGIKRLKVLNLAMP